MMQLQRISQTCVRSSRSKMGLSRIAPTCLNMRRITPPRASPTFNTAPLIESATPETTPRFHLHSCVLSCRKAQIALGPFTVKWTSCFLISWYHYDDSVNKHYRMDRIAAEWALSLKISTAVVLTVPNRVCAETAHFLVSLCPPAAACRDKCCHETQSGVQVNSSVWLLY